MSGTSSPASPSETLTGSPALKPTIPSEPSLYSNPTVPAYTVIEHIATHNSSVVFVYDLAEQLGFGLYTKQWAQAITAQVVSMQTRAGAGLTLVGRLSEGTSEQTLRGSVLTAYTSLRGLTMMAPALSGLPPPSPKSRLIIHVPDFPESEVGLANSSSISTVIPFLPKHVVVLVSATPQQSVHFAQLAYQLTSFHVVHVFDHRCAAREIGTSFSPLPEPSSISADAAEKLAQAGYPPFSYTGNPNADTALVVLNGPVAQRLVALAEHATSWGVAVVSLVRPWNESLLPTVFPGSVKQVHVLETVPYSTFQGSLHSDILGSLLQTQIKVVDHRITPEQTQLFFSAPTAFVEYIASLIPSHSVAFQPRPHERKLIFFSSPNSPLSTLPYLIESVFLQQKGIFPRLIHDYDAFSKPGGVAGTRLVLSNSINHVPIPFVLPYSPTDAGQADFLGIFDQALLKSHSLLKYVKAQSSILVVTNWTEEEFLANLPPSNTLLMNQKQSRIFLIDSKSIALHFAGATSPLYEAIQNFIVHLAFVRLYLGSIATESSVLKVAIGSHENGLIDTDLAKVGSHTWEGLTEVELPFAIEEKEATAPPLRDFDPNTVVLDFRSGDDAVQLRVGSWHDAARQFIFSTVYSPPTLPHDENAAFSQDPALRPDLPERTFLATCTVNRRLTPLEYDRNVFHLEFDTRGTGLKYAIGEALGVHAWNDEKEVTDFCHWYSIDPSQLVTIPIVHGEPRMHTRTVFQILQQQIDLFGRPPKAFYTQLAAHAKLPVERHALLFIGSPEGSATFKKLAEKDTVTFCDVLHMYPSARPGIEVLCEMVGDIKPRHYSIASAQSVVGDRIDLLVVTVEWRLPSGRYSSLIISSINRISQVHSDMDNVPVS